MAREPEAAHLLPSTVSQRRTANPRSSAELLIDCEEDRTLRTVLVGMLRERQQ